MSDVIVTTFYNDNKMDKKDRTIVDYFDNANGKEVEQLIRAMEGYIVMNSYMRDKQTQLIECLDKKDYIKYYKLIKKMAKFAINELEDK